MKKKYKLTIDALIRDNITLTRTSITMKARELQLGGLNKGLATGALMQKISLMINKKVEDASKEIVVSIFEKSQELHFTYSKSDLKYIEERLMETYPLEVTRMYASELEKKPHFEMAKRQLDVNKNVASSNVKNTIKKGITEYSLDKKMRRFSKETRVANWLVVLGILVGAIVSISIALING